MHTPFSFVTTRHSGENVKIYRFLPQLFVFSSLSESFKDSNHCHAHVFSLHCCHNFSNSLVTFHPPKIISFPLDYEQPNLHVVSLFPRADGLDAGTSHGGAATSSQVTYEQKNIRKLQKVRNPTRGSSGYPSPCCAQ